MTDIPQQPLDELEWRSPEWINIYGLRTDNILEYFSLSPFWDRQCNNQILKMQRQFQANSNVNENGQPIMMIIPTFDAELRKLRGIEYVVHMIKEPDLWIIRKQKRIGDGSNAYSKANNINTTMTIDNYLNGGPGLDVADDVVVLSDYFCIGSKVYMATNIHSILRQGILSISNSLETAVDRLGEMLQSASRDTTNTAHNKATTATTTTTNNSNNSNNSNEESLFLLSVQQTKE